MRSLCALALVLTAATFPPAGRASDAVEFSTIRHLVVQHNGRLKALDTFARERLRFVHGRERFDGQDPIETVLSLAFDAERWDQELVLDVPYIPLFEALGHDKEKKYLSLAEFRGHLPTLRGLGRAPGLSPRADKRLAEAANELAARADALRALTEFENSVPIVPGVSDDPEAEWMPLASATGHSEKDMAAVRAAFESLRTAFLDKDGPAFDEASRHLIERLRALNPAVYPKAGRMALEAHYNAFKPFRAAWLLYVATLLLALISLWSKRAGLYVAMFVVLALSTLVHTYGLAVRTIIAGRAPLTNMYESLIFMSWGIAALGVIFEAKYRLRFAALIASVLGILTITIAQRLTIDINPAVAVLRSAWLSYHVLTVMLGYSAFAVALGAGHLVVGRAALGLAQTERPDRLDDFVYRVLQVGVLFLTAGIVTGAVWANYSWGRSWGWDPKETWSLITLLGYLAVLHARHQKWLGGFGMGVASILCFLLVVMTYYGVNYILRGLHSYAGDEPHRIPAWLIAYVVFEGLYVGAAALIVSVRRQARRVASG